LDVINDGGLREKSIFGVLDSYLSNNVGFLSSIARQQSYHVYKA